MMNNFLVGEQAKVSWNSIIWNIIDIFEYKGMLRVKLEYDLTIDIKARSSAWLKDLKR